jgi:type II secretory ATPase GspE/PulE/Tfp pilus assembly ATPase PilB-like protein
VTFGLTVNANPISRFTNLVLMQAWHDSATELVVSSADESGAHIRYRVEGELYEMSPPPPHIRTDVLNELATLAGVADSPFPRSGTIELPFSTVPAKWKLEMASADADCVLTPILELRSQNPSNSRGPDDGFPQ